VVREHELDLPVAVAVLPPAEADEEGGRASGGREPRRLGVKTDEWHVRRRLSGECREPCPVDRQLSRRHLAPDDPSLGGHDDLAVNGRR
jgi:hypothetical protein